MKKLVVTNKGEVTRHRLGVGFFPGIPTEITVRNQSELIAVQAVRDFSVQVVDEPEAQPEATGAPQEPEIDVTKLNIPDVLEAVESGKISVEAAIAKEITGKNRPKLLDKLEQIKAGE